MQLEKIVAEIRPREPREAVDLGFALARHWLKPLILIQVIASGLYLVLAVLLSILLYMTAALIWIDSPVPPFWAHTMQSPLLFGFIFWWFRPMVDRWGLMYVSQAMFAGQSTIKGITKTQTKQLFHKFFSGLFYDRLDVKRSMMMPVSYLEGVKGSRLRKRRKVVSEYGGDVGSNLTIWCHLFEQLLAIASVTFLVLMLPSGMDLNQNDLLLFFWNPDFSNVFWMGVIFFAAWYVVTLIISPYYIAAGFMLYLNSRSHQEGWDIEIVFRKLAQRIENQNKRAEAASAKHAVKNSLKNKTATTIVAAFAALIAIEYSAHAQTVEETTKYAQDTPEGAINNVLSSEAFERKKVKVKRFKPKNSPAKKKQANNNTNTGNFSTGLDFGSLFKAIAIGVLVAGIGYLIYAIYRKMGDVKSNAPPPKLPKAKSPDPIVERVGPSEALPDRIPEQVWSLWRNGQQIDAISLLYRGALKCVSQQFNVTFENSETEYECRRRIRKLKQQPDIVSYCDKLLRTWLDLRYAGRSPNADHVQSLCRNWPFDEKVVVKRTVISEREDA